MEQIYIGTITGTHGIKGELKVISEFEKPNLVFKTAFPIYILGEKHQITSHRIHQNKHLITIDSLFNINDVVHYRGKKVWINRSDLEFDGYLMQDLIGFHIYEENEYLGNVIDIMETKTGYLLKVENQTKYYIPFQDPFIKEVNQKEKRIIVSNAKGLMI